MSYMCSSYLSFQSRSLTPLRGQRTGTAAHRAVPVSVRGVMLQSGGQQPGQRSRPAGGRTRDGIELGGGEAERVRDLENVGLGWNGQLGQAAKPTGLARVVRHRGTGRG